MVPRTFSRRAALRAAGAVALPLALAGCSSSCPDHDPPSPSTVLGPTDAPSGPLPAAAVEAAWPTYRHDQRNTGFAPAAAAPADPPVLAWRAEVASSPTDPQAAGSPSAPALADGVLYVVAGDGTLHALDARDGTERWTVATVPAHDAPSVRADQDLVVVAGEAGVVAVDVPSPAGDAPSPAEDVPSPSADGAEAGGASVRWRVGRAATASAVVGDDLVFVPVEDALVALDLEDGSEAWSAPFDGPVSRPALVGDAVLATAANTRALAVADGGDRWRAGADGVSAFPVVDDAAGLAYLGTYEGLLAVDLADGEQVWSFERGSGRGFDAPVVTPETLYAVELVGEGPDAIYALDPASGEPSPRWCSWLGEGTVSAAAPDTVLVETPVRADQAPSQGHALQAFRPDTGAATWQFRASSPVRAPALGSGAAFVVTRSGAVCALGGGGAGGGPGGGAGGGAGG